MSNTEKMTREQKELIINATSAYCDEYGGQEYGGQEYGESIFDNYDDLSDVSEKVLDEWIITIVCLLKTLLSITKNKIQEIWLCQ